ncbi:MAG TPA: SRPBCC domain-containing protein [Thermoplasmata archaeon]|nr:SRPBCC domain-containing protein [Thermoplasmata archaeon]
MAKIGPIRHSYYYAASPERVFAALTDPRELTKWFVRKARVVPRKGGTYRLTWGPYTMRGRVLEIEPPRHLVLRWIDQFGDGKVFETEAAFELTKKGKGTVLSLTHRGFRSGKKWVALFGGVQSGWAYYLVNLKSFLNHGNDLRSDHDALG